MFNKEQHQDIVVNYNIETVYDAVLNAVAGLSGFKVLNENRATHVININVSLSMFSWGETMTVSLNPLSEMQTQVFISSNSKLGTEIAGKSKNRKNVEKLVNALNSILG